MIKRTKKNVGGRFPSVYAVYTFSHQGRWNRYGPPLDAGYGWLL